MLRDFFIVEGITVHLSVTPDLIRASGSFPRDEKKIPGPCIKFRASKPGMTFRLVITAVLPGGFTA
jgi:hypothetical protein